MPNKSIIIFKWMIFYVIIFFSYIIQSTPYLFEFFGVKANLLIPLSISIAMFEGELSCCICGAICGMLMDISSNTLLGFNAIILMFCCITVRLLICYLMRNNFLNFLLFISITILLQGFMKFVFFYLIWNYEDVFIIFYRNILPSMIYTFLISSLVYILIKKIFDFFDKKYINK